MLTISFILSIAGSIGLIIFGMKLMSEAILKASGMQMRKILVSVTSNPVKGLFAGTFFTSIIQSSTAVTVMLISFANAGLIRFTESIGLIMGANIGTTLTAWMVSIIGFNFKISYIALPLVGLCLPLIFSNKGSRKYWAEIVIGFALIFIGLDFLKTVFPDFHSHPEILKFVTKYTNLGFVTTIVFLLIGIVLTSLLQSSSVATAITLVLCHKGWINFDAAGAMIIGENIGTTLTGLIASLVTNQEGKKVALYHLFFNIFGLIWVLPLFSLFVELNVWLTEFFYSDSPMANLEAIPMGLALFHTSYNVINSLILLILLAPVKRIINSLFKGDDVSSLKFINSGILSTSEISVYQGRKELLEYGKRTQKMFGMVKDLFQETNPSKFDAKWKLIAEFEDDCDIIEQEIAEYLTKITETSISEDSTRLVSCMLKVSNELESACDACFNLSKTLKRKKKEKIWFTQDLRDNMTHMFVLVDDALVELIINLDKNYSEITIEHAEELEKRINKYRKELRKTHFKSFEKLPYNYKAGVIYNELFNHCERIGDYIFNVASSIEEFNASK